MRDLRDAGQCHPLQTERTEGYQGRPPISWKTGTSVEGQKSVDALFTVDHILMNVRF